ncbi:hypothetical protein PVAP13_7NG154600 [Panicum virgatum]|uniref:Uncharacterized protein n=1 Tax=Panicum virgatum TaxID=38727 RepID=A0A8T0PYJ0_PANVG|nr:hypothetical protein PVAP13_7NG154600 [Panicum virgatum]
MWPTQRLGHPTPATLSSGFAPGMETREAASQQAMPVPSCPGCCRGTATCDVATSSHCVPNDGRRIRTASGPAPEDVYGLRTVADHSSDVYSRYSIARKTKTDQ